MTNDEMIALAVEAGFAAAEVIDTDKIVFDPMFRPFCEENLCGQYGVNYACPPDCGTVEQMKARVLAHKKGLVLQTIVQIADYADNEAFKLGKKQHNGASIRLMQEFRQAGVPGFLIGASGCALCSPCALRSGEPCRFPDSRYSCMSAYCIFVRKLAEECGMEYDCGEGLTAFFGMYIFD